MYSVVLIMLFDCDRFDAGTSYTTPSSEIPVDDQIVPVHNGATTSGATATNNLFNNFCFLEPKT